MAPPKKTFGFGSTYNPNKYTRRSTDTAGTAGGKGGINDTAAANAGRPPRRRRDANQTTGGSVMPSYTNSVFKPQTPMAPSGRD